LVENILKYKNIKYQSYGKQEKLTEENKTERLNFARLIKDRESDCSFIVFPVECSFWQENMKPKQLWTDSPADEEGTGTHGIKVHCWGSHRYGDSTN